MHRAKPERSTAIEMHIEELFRDQTVYGSRVELYHALASTTNAEPSPIHRKLERLMVSSAKVQGNPVAKPTPTGETVQKNSVVTLRPPRRAQSSRRKPHASVVSLR